MFGAGDVRELPDVSKSPRSQANQTAVIVHGLKRDGIIKMDGLGHFCLHTPTQMIKLLCVCKGEARLRMFPCSVPQFPHQCTSPSRGAAHQPHAMVAAVPCTRTKASAQGSSFSLGHQNPATERN